MPAALSEDSSHEKLTRRCTASVWESRQLFYFE
jgi:hypothetical protein